VNPPSQTEGGSALSRPGTPLLGRWVGPKAAIALVVVLQLAALAGMIAKRQHTLNNGTLVVLETKPVDPRDIFRGDYVSLSYTIGSLHPETTQGVAALLPSRDTPKRGDDVWGFDKPKRFDVYITLAPRGAVWQAVAASPEWTAAPSGQVVIHGRARVNYTWNHIHIKRNKAGEEISWDLGDDKVYYLDVDYGIERYYVPEGAGRALEQPRPGDKITLQIAVDEDGKSAVKAVLVNGKPRYAETLF